MRIVPRVMPRSLPVAAKPGGKRWEIAGSGDDLCVAGNS